MLAHDISMPKTHSNRDCVKLSLVQQTRENPRSDIGRPIVIDSTIAIIIRV